MKTINFPIKSQLLNIFAALYFIMILIFTVDKPNYIKLIFMIFVILSSPYIISSIITLFLKLLTCKKSLFIFYRLLSITNIAIGIIIFSLSTYGLVVELESANKNSKKQASLDKPVIMIPENSSLQIKVKNFKDTVFCRSVSPKGDICIFPVYQKRQKRGFLTGVDIVNCSQSPITVAGDSITPEFFIEKYSEKGWEHFWDLSEYICCDKRSWNINLEQSWGLDGFADSESENLLTYRFSIVINEKRLISQEFQANLSKPDTLHSQISNCNDCNCIPYAEELIRRGKQEYNNYNLEKAVFYFNKAIKIKPKRILIADAYYGRAQAYSEMEQYEKTIDDYSHVLFYYPKSSTIYNDRGFIFFTISEYKKALSDFNHAIELNPEYADAYLNRAMVYCEIKQDDDAIPDYSKSIELEPTLEAYMGRGISYLKISEFSRAGDDFTKAIQLSNESNDELAMLYYLRAAVYSKLNQYDKAISDSTTSIKLEASNDTAYYIRGTVYLEMHKYKVAVSDYTNAIKLSPDNIDYYYARASAYKKDNNYKEALSDYEQIISLEPDDARAKKALASIQKKMETNHPVASSGVSNKD